MSALAVAGERLRLSGDVVSVLDPMTRQQLFAAFFFAVFFFLLYQFYRIFGLFLVPLAWAALLAFIFYPLHARLTVALRGRNSLAAFCFTTTVILVVMVPTVLLIIRLASESVALYQSSSEFVANGQLQQLLDKLKASAPARASKTLIPMLESWNIDIAAMAANVGNTLSTFLVSQAAGIAKNVAAFVVDFCLITFALFFFFRDGARIVGGIRSMLPMEPEYKDLVLRRLYGTLSAVVQGTLAVAAVQGVFLGLGFWALGVPFALFLGCAAAFFSLLPVGSTAVWGGVAVYLLFAGLFWRALLLAIWGAVVVGVLDNVIRPLIIGERAEIPTVLLFFGILGGLHAYGLLGVFLAPVVIAMVVAFFRIYKERYSTPE
jgi:predicted PurR-regulated permease PerM